MSIWMSLEKTRKLSLFSLRNTIKESIKEQIVNMSTGLIRTNRLKNLRNMIMRCIFLANSLDITDRDILTTIFSALIRELQYFIMTMLFMEIRLQIWLHY